jgi:hypothetical protein
MDPVEDIPAEDTDRDPSGDHEHETDRCFLKIKLSSDYCRQRKAKHDQRRRVVE